MFVILYNGQPVRKWTKHTSVYTGTWWVANEGHHEDKDVILYKTEEQAIRKALATKDYQHFEVWEADRQNRLIRRMWPEKEAGR